MDRERLDTICERVILALMLAALVFGPLATGAVRAQDFLVLQFLAAAAAGVWVLRLWLGEHPQLLWPPACWGVLAFTLYAIGRYYTADIEYVARQELIRVLVYALLFYITVNNLYRQESVKLISLVLIFLGMAVAMYAVYQFLSGSDKVWTFTSPYKGRAGGTYICPNHLAGFLEMLLPLALAYTVVGRVSAALKVWLGYAALVMAVGIAVTLSRGGWLATGGSLLLFLALLLVRKRLSLPAIISVLVVAAVIGVFFSRSNYVQQRFQKAFPEGQVTKPEDIRFQLWQPAVRIWRDHPWIGAGPAHFDRLFPAYRPQAIQMRPDRVHNDYLNTLADWGLIGALLVAGIFVLAVIGIVKMWSAVRGNTRDFGSNQSSKFAVVLGGSVGLIAILLHAMVDFNMHVPANAILAVTLLALVTAHSRFATDDHWLNLPLWSRALVTLALLGGIFYLGSQGLKRMAENRHLSAAARMPENLEDHAKALEKALAAESNNPDTWYRLGEHHRKQSWEGNTDYVAQAEAAIHCYRQGIKLNPFDAAMPLGLGMCLDWLDKQNEAEPFIAEAQRLDPNNYFITAHIGWHYEQTGDFAAARDCFMRSLRLHWEHNPIARNHLEIVNRRLAEGAAK